MNDIKVEKYFVDVPKPPVKYVITLDPREALLLQYISGFENTVPDAICDSRFGSSKHSREDMHAFIVRLRTAMDAGMGS